MFKRSDGKRRRKSRSKRSKRCRSLLGRKIGINIHEGIYANKEQAIAVAYSQVRKRHPSCRRILKKSKKRRSIRRKINDGVQGTGENNCLTDEQQNVFKNLFTLNANANGYEPKFFQTFTFINVYGGNTTVQLPNLDVSIILPGPTSDLPSLFIFSNDNNTYIGHLNKIIEYTY